MITLTPDMTWEALRIPPDELGGLTPEQIDTTPLIVVEFGGLNDFKPKKQPGEVNNRLRIVGSILAGQLGERFTHETTERVMHSGVSEHTDGRSGPYHQLNVSFVTDKDKREDLNSVLGTEFAVRLRRIPHGFNVGTMFGTSADTKQKSGQVIAKDYGDTNYLQRPHDASGNPLNPHRTYLSDRISGKHFETLITAREIVALGDVVVFFNGMGDDNSDLFPTHETHTMKFDPESGAWTPTVSLRRSIALGRVA